MEKKGSAVSAPPKAAAQFLPPVNLSGPVGI